MEDADDTERHPEEVTLLDYVVGDLGPDSSDDIRRHVERCSTCRERIVDLSLDMEEIDRLPMVAIPHDILRGVLGAEQRRRQRRVAPLLILLAVGVGIVALFQIGGMRADAPVSAQRQVVLQTADADPAGVVDDLLSGMPHSVVIDRDDERHLVVLVSDADVGTAVARLTASAPTAGRSYVVDVGGTGQLPGSAG